MAARNPTTAPAPGRARANGFARYLPFLDWLLAYRRRDLSGDLMAGMIVAIVLIPQAMAYALLAGLPPQAGLYASLLPLALYGLLGTSRSLSVGPAAIISLLVVSSVAGLAPPDSLEYLTLVLVLTFMVGVIQLAMGLVQMGFIVNFLSHPVISGFISAAALVIAFSQVQHLTGIKIPTTGAPYQSLVYAIQHIGESNLITLGIGLGSIVLLFYFRNTLGSHLRRLLVPNSLLGHLAKAGPLAMILLGILVVWGFGLHGKAGVNIVGVIPAGLPPLTMPTFDWNDWKVLLPSAVTISLIGFMESISLAKALAIRRRQKVDANQELVALGTANLGAALTGGFPVAGGFSRSVVNFSSGANTGLASLIAALLIALTVVFFTPFFYFLPQAVLAATIIVSVVGLIDLATFKRVWRYSKADAAALVITFSAVLAVGIETGIVAGAVSAVALYLWRTSRPQVAILGRVGESEHFRNVRRFEVETYPHILPIRVDESLYFANTKYLEDSLLRAVADHHDIKHLVLVCSGINYIDASGLDTLESLIDQLRDVGVDFYMAEVKGPVLSQLRKVGFVERLGADRIFLSTHLAMRALVGRTATTPHQEAPTGSSCSMEDPPPP